MCQQVYYWAADVELLGELRLAATERGLCELSLRGDSEAAFRARLMSDFTPQQLAYQKEPLIISALNEIEAYLAGRLQWFTTPLDLRGTAFQKSVWGQVQRIPYGTTSTYRDLAERIGRPRSVRAVGAANAANPLPLFVPCHRVIGVDGSLRGYGGGIAIKAALIQLERAYARQ
jgi:O-6-methylguanine DNA methyltransferase